MKINKKTKEFLERIKELSGEDINKCYQCGKCSAGCPAVNNMSILPNMIIRRLQLGQMDKILREEAIWKCASCMTCWSRCPRGVNLCNIMEALRSVYMENKNNGHKESYSEISISISKTAPQQAIVSRFRKYTC